MSTVTRTRPMTTPEDVADEFCHLYPPWTASGVTLCGVRGNVGMPHGWYEGQSVCECGNPVCPRCKNLLAGGTG